MEIAIALKSIKQVANNILTIALPRENDVTSNRHPSGPLWHPGGFIHTQTLVARDPTSVFNRAHGQFIHVLRARRYQNAAVDDRPDHTHGDAAQAIMEWRPSSSKRRCGLIVQEAKGH